MKKLLLLFILLLIAGIAYAQSTATHLVLGYETTTGCPGNASVCWLPYSQTNPMPVGSN